VSRPKRDMQQRSMLISGPVVALVRRWRMS
jgi:hypothetical protein